jgi:hypothetical protein
MGGYRVQARTAETARKLKADALALADAGAGAVVLEGVPREVAAEITAELPFPPSALARAGLRWADPCLPRPAEPDLRAGRQVCAPLRGCGRR